MKLSSRCDWNMRSAKHELVREREVRNRLLVRHVDVLRVLRAVERLFLIESVHPAVRARQAPGPVARRKHRRRGVIDDVLTLEADGLQFDRLTVRVLSARNRVGVRIALKQVVEGAVLLHDDDDVLDLTARGVREEARRRSNARNESRRDRTRRAASPATDEGEQREQRDSIDRRVDDGRPAGTGRTRVRALP